MKILMVSPEGPPLSRAGAIVDVLDALPRELRTRGHEVSVALPFYRAIREDSRFKERDTGVTLDVRVGDKTYIAEYLEGRSASGVQLFLGRMLTEYLRLAMSRAHYELLGGGEGFYGEIPGLQGVLAQAETLEACREELASTLEDWLLFRVSRHLPIQHL